MIKALLAIVSLFKPLYRTMGVDYEQLAAIVRTKLLMDNRRNASAFGKQKDKDQNYKFLFAVILYAVFGIFFAITIYTFPSVLVSMAIYHAFVIVMIAMTLISDFSSVLLDTSDNTIILPRPVSGKTLVASRITHILLYIGQITAGIMIAPLIAVGLKFGALFTVCFILTTLLAVLFAVVFTNGFYLLLMQWTSEEKLKSILNYFQIGFTILFMGGYQILPRIMGNDLLRVVAFELHWWSFLIPPFWMAGTLDMLQNGIITSMHLIALALTLIVPIGGFYLMNKFLSPRFASKLADLGTNSAIAEERSESATNTRFSLGRVLARPGLEQAAYDVCNKMLGRDRKLKLKIYPSIGTLFIMFFVVFMQGNTSLTFKLENLNTTSLYIFLLYAPFFIVLTAMAEIIYTDDFKAAWVYTSMPVDRPGYILSGSLKAVFAKFFLPGFFIAAVLVLFVWGSSAIDDVLFAFTCNIFLFTASASIGIKRIPFSMDPSARAAVGFIRSMIVLILLGAMGVAHYLLGFVPYTLWVGIPFMLMLAHFLLKGYQETKWAEIAV